MFSRFNRHYFDLLWVMTTKEFTSRYKQAVFGFLWILLNPILQMLIIGTVFSFFMPIKNYFLFLFTGLLPWQFFSMTLSKTTTCFVNDRDLLQKSVFPRETILLSISLSNLLNLLISEALLLITLFIITPTDPVSFILLIPAIIWILLFTIASSLFTASLNVRYRDVAFFVQTILMVWFYATPVLYSLEVLPEKIKQLMLLNPLASPFALCHSALLHHPLPQPSLIAINLVTTFMIFILGIWIYKRESPYFVDWL